MDAFWPLGASLAAVVLGLALAVLPVVAGERLAGPVPALVMAVIDGDTLEVRARIWLGQEVETRVRVAGLDTPELRGGCPEERRLAAEAKRRTESLISGGDIVLHDISFGKYAGRVIARVTTAGGADLAGALIGAGLARVYDGGARADWCVHSASVP